MNRLLVEAVAREALEVGTQSSAPTARGKVNVNQLEALVQLFRLSGFAKLVPSSLYIIPEPLLSSSLNVRILYFESRNVGSLLFYYYNYLYILLELFLFN